MKNLNLVVYIILICILVYLVFNKKEDESTNKVYLIILVILFILFCFSSYQSVEGLDNTEGETYDIDTYETKSLKVMNNFTGNIKKQFIDEIPIGFIYLTTDSGFDANKSFSGKWESIGNDEFGNSFIMIANDGDSGVNYDANNNRNCAYKKGIDSKCPKDKTSFDMIPNIKYKTLFGTKVRYGGSEYKTRLTIDHIPPHVQYLRGGTKDDDPEECYARVPFGFCIDYNHQVGNASDKSFKYGYKRINNTSYEPMTIKDFNDITKKAKKGNPTIPENENTFTTQVDNKVEEHNNQPPYVNVYAWRKLSN